MHKGLLLGVIVAIMLNIFVGLASADSAEWWNSSWRYRLNITVDTSPYNRTDWPIEEFINFTNELKNLGAAGAFDSNSTRVIEYNASTGEPLFVVPSQFDNGSKYNPTSNAVGTVTWLLNGSRQPGTYYFHIYFDILENGAKQAPAYPTDLAYSSSGDIFWLNNSRLEVGVERSSEFRNNRTSGIYYAAVDGSVLFNAARPDQTIEYSKYRDIPGNLYGFEFSNYTLIVNGSVKKVVELVGNEVTWGTQTTTGSGRMTKRYTLFANNQWMRIEQIYFSSTDITRFADAPELGTTLDVERAFSNANLIGNPPCSCTSTDPYSWQSVYTAGKGLGIINVNETGTTNFYAKTHDDGATAGDGKIGIALSSTAIPAQTSIGETSVVYFNNASSHTPVEDLRNRLASDAVKNRSQSETWTATPASATQYDVYNLGENVLFWANVTLDTHNLSSSANATLTDPTSSNLSFQLFDDGTNGDVLAGDKAYTNNYTLPNTSATGSWLLTTRIYDATSFLLNQSAKGFNVTSEYSATVTVLSEFVSAGTPVSAQLTVRNYRGNTGIPGAGVSCAYSGSSGGDTAVTGITDDAGGNYSLSFTSPSDAGLWTLKCNATKLNNFGTGNDTFYTVKANTTQLAIDLTPGTFVAINVTQLNSQKIAVRANVTNVENGTAYAANITLFLPTGMGWTANTSFYQCGDVPIFNGCVRDFEVTIKEATAPGNYFINTTVRWRNYDNTTGGPTRDDSLITVAQNPVADIVQTELNDTVSEGTQKNIGKFNLSSIGNYRLENVTFTCVSGTVCTDLTVTFFPSSLTNLTQGQSTNISVNVTVPEGLDPGNYTGVIKANSSNGANDTLTLNIVVPESKTWTASSSPSTCATQVLVNNTGTLCTVTLNNTGNMPLAFNITPPGQNFTAINQTNLTLPKSMAGLFLITYNSTGAALDTTYNGIYVVNATTSGATPSTSEINFSVTVVLGPSVELFLPAFLRQNDSLSILAGVNDRASKGIAKVNATVTKPDGSTNNLNLTNITASTMGGTSNWSAAFTNTTLRGNYTITVYAYDQAGGRGSAQGVAAVYAKLIMNISAGTSYQQGDTGSFDPLIITDALGTPLSNANVTIKIYSSTPSLWQTLTLVTEADGMVPVSSTFFSITSNAPKGTWTWQANVSYFDSTANINSRDNTTGSFQVTSKTAGLPLYLKVDIGDQYNPGDLVSLYAIVKDTTGLLVSGATVTANITGPNLTTSVTFNQVTGPSYQGNFTLPSNASLGTYYVTAKATYSGDEANDAAMFSVVEKGALLSLKIDVGSYYSPGKTVDLYATVNDKFGLLLSGASVVVNITAPDGNSSTFNLTDVPGPAYKGNYTLPSNAVLGTYYVSAKATYGADTAYDAAMFTVTDSIFAEVAPPVVAYTGQIMKINMLVMNPGTGAKIDPDTMSLILYYTEGYNMTKWRNLSKADFTTDGDFYVYSEYLNASNTYTGSYLAVFEAKAGTTAAWDLASFRIAAAGPFDVRIESISSTVKRGGTLTFTINMTNMGNETNKDVNVTYWVNEQYRATEAILIPDPFVPYAFERSFSNLDLAVGTYTLYVSVIYDPTFPPAQASQTFTVTEEGGAPPPVFVGGGGGGGGGAEEAPEKPTIGILNITEAYPPEIGVEKGGTAYLTLTVNNTGGSPLHNITASVDGIPSTWFTLIKGEASSLGKGESLVQIIKIEVPINITQQEMRLTVTVSSAESKDELTLRLRIFESITELLDWEIARTKEAMREAEDKAFVAIADGRNVTAALAMLRDANGELRRAEELLASKSYKEALKALEDTRQYLRRINTLIDETKKPEVVVITVPPPTVTPAPIVQPITPTTPAPTPQPAALPIRLILALGASLIALASMVALLFMRLSRKMDAMTGAKRTLKLKFKSEQRTPPLQSSEHQRKKDEIVKLLETLKLQHERGIISDKTYMELKRKNEERLSDVEKKMRG